MSRSASSTSPKPSPTFANWGGTSTKSQWRHVIDGPLYLHQRRYIFFVNPEFEWGHASLLVRLPLMPVVASNIMPQPRPRLWPRRGHPSAWRVCVECPVDVLATCPSPTAKCDSSGWGPSPASSALPWWLPWPKAAGHGSVWPWHGPVGPRPTGAAFGASGAAPKKITPVDDWLVTILLSFWPWQPWFVWRSPRFSFGVYWFWSILELLLETQWRNPGVLAGHPP